MTINLIYDISALELRFKIQLYSRSLKYWRKIHI